MLNQLLNIVLLLLSFNNLYSQPKNENLLKAKKHLRRSDYASAAKVYENYLLNKPNDQYAQAEYSGILYFDLKDYAKSNFYLKQALENSSDTLSFGIPLLKTEIYLGNYDYSLILIEKFNSYFSRKKKYSKQRNELLLIKNNINYYFQNKDKLKHINLEIGNLGNGINSIYEDYVPITDKEEHFILLTSRRKLTKNEHITYYENSYKEKMFFAKRKKNGFDSLEKVTYEFNKHHFLNNNENESYISLSPDGKELFLFKKGTIWKSNRINDKWSNPKKFEEQILDIKYTNHGTLSADGKFFYFSSEIKSGKGGLDLYYIYKNDLGIWSSPSNISALNTNGNEQGPFISQDGKTLYFSSDSLPGFGGYDIFRSNFDGKNWSEPENLGIPFNSQADEIFFTQTEDKNTGYFSSNRIGTTGNYDIYRYFSYDHSDFKNKNIVEVVFNKDTTCFISFSNIDLIIKNLISTFASTHKNYYRLNDSVVFSDIDSLKISANTQHIKKIEIEQQLECKNCPFKKVNFYTIYSDKYHKDSLFIPTVNSNSSSLESSNTLKIINSLEKKQANEIFNYNDFKKENKFFIFFNEKNKIANNDDFYRFLDFLKSKNTLNISLISPKAEKFNFKKTFNFYLNRRMIKKYLSQNGIEKEIIKCVTISEATNKIENSNNNLNYIEIQFHNLDDN
jgi:hypothetical protein